MDNPSHISCAHASNMVKNQEMQLTVVTVLVYMCIKSESQVMMLNDDQMDS